MFYLFNSILMLKTKNCIVSKKTASTDPTQTALVRFRFYFKSQPNQTACFFILRFGWLLTSKPNQTAPQTPLILSNTFVGECQIYLSIYFIFLSGSLVARIHLIRWISRVSGVRTPTSAYNNTLSYQLSYAHRTECQILYRD